MIVCYANRWRHGGHNDFAGAQSKCELNSATMSVHPRQLLILHLPETKLLAMTFAITYHPERQPNTTPILHRYFRSRVKQHYLVAPIRQVRIPNGFLDDLRDPLWIVLIWVFSRDILFTRRYPLDAWSRILRGRRIGFGIASVVFLPIRLFVLLPLHLSHSTPLACVYPPWIVSRGINGRLQIYDLFRWNGRGLLLLFRGDFGRCPSL